MSLRVPNVSDLTSLHGLHNYLVVLVKAGIFHLKLLVNLPSFRIVDKLAIVMPCLMLVVDIVRGLNQCTLPNLEHELDDSFWVDILDIIIGAIRDGRVVCNDLHLH